MEENKIWAIKDGYLVHRDGSIYKLNYNRTKTMRRIKQWQNSDGYLKFNCNGKTTFAHRFVAECFLPNPNNLPFINHKNEIKNDNRVENLEWCNHKYNVNYGTRNKRSGISNLKVQRNNPKKSKKVFQYTLNKVLIKEWVSLSEIGRVLGFGIGHISSCCLGKRKSAYDYFWTYQPITQ